MASVNPNGTLKGRTALVTGASRGIGEAIAVRLAMEGARVVVSARTAEDGQSKLPGTLHATMERIRAAGGEARAIRADLSDEADRVRLVAEATAAYGPIDILVNDAAVTFFIPVETFPKKRFDLMMEVQGLGADAPGATGPAFYARAEVGLDREHLVRRRAPPEAALRPADRGHRLWHVQGGA